MHLLVLANTEGTSGCLIHKSGRPPGAAEDDRVVVLEVQTRAAGVELDEEDILEVAGAEDLAGGDLCVTLLVGQASVVGADVADEGKGAEEGG